MNRRVLAIVAIVAAALAIAPQLPRWLPAIAGWIEQADVASWWHAVQQWVGQMVRLAAAWPWLLPAVAGAAAFALIIVTTWRIALRRGARSVQRRAARPIVAAAAATMAAPPPAAVAVARSAAPAPPAPRAPTAPTTPSHARFARPAAAERTLSAPPPRVMSGRGVVVRRLVADGRTVAEIARATGIGQDAVRAMAAGT